MTALRATSFIFPLLLVPVGGLLLAPLQPASHAAPPAMRKQAATRVATKVPALSFNMLARIGFSMPGEAPAPEQLLRARVWLRGDAARIESNSGGDASVILFAPPHVYRLLPKARAGVRWKMDTRKNAAVASFSPRELLANPGNIRTALTKGGAKKTGTAKLAGVACDLYTAQNFRGKGTTARAWLRQSDALPVRLEVKGPQLNVAASWRDYKRHTSLPPALFQPPASFKIREAQGQPPLAGL